MNAREPMLLRALIVDDEALARTDLEKLLQADPEVAVVTQAATLDEAREALVRDQPNLVFLDVELRRADGFELVADIPETTAVVVVTTEARYALRAFEVNVFDYLTKPVSPQRLALSLSRVRRGRKPKQRPTRAHRWFRGWLS